MVGYLFLLVVICFFGWRAYLILKKDPSKVDDQINRSGGGGGSSVPFENDNLVDGEPEEFKEAK